MRFDLEDIETIYHGKCEHFDCNNIRSRLCIKRYYFPYNLRTGKQFKLAICNEFIKLKFHEFYGKIKDSSYRSRAYDLHVKEIITQSILEASGCFNEATYLIGREFDDNIIYVDICFKPKVRFAVNIIEGLELYLNGHRALAPELNYKLRRWVDEIYQYKKYKTKYSEIIRLIKKISIYGKVEGENEIINDIFIKILELKTKTK